MRRWAAGAAWVLSLWMAMLILSPAAGAQDVELAGLFSRAKINGTMVISSLDGKKEYVHNPELAKERRLPASTFKIPNSLMALELKAVKSVDEVFKWDGRKRFMPEWNKDQTLRTAMPASCVWVYQEIAKRVGNRRYLEELAKLKYGNRKTGPEVTTFWLSGDIAISAREQVDFLKRLFRNQLPYGRRVQALVKDLLVVERAPQYTIRAKTGWAMRPDKQHGWYVGWVEKAGETWFFATMIDIREKGDGPMRKTLTMEGLRLKGII